MEKAACAPAQRPLAAAGRYRGPGDSRGHWLRKLRGLAPELRTLPLLPETCQFLPAPPAPSRCVRACVCVCVSVLAAGVVGGAWDSNRLPWPFFQPKIQACELTQERPFAVGMASPLKSVVFGGFRQTEPGSFVTLTKELNLSEQSRVLK